MSRRNGEELRFRPKRAFKGILGASLEGAPLRSVPLMAYNCDVSHGAVAQGREQRFPKPRVAGSNPVSPTHFYSPAQTPLQAALPTTPPAASKRIIGDFTA